MRRAATFALAILLGCGAQFASLPIAAQGIAVTPSELDFGAVDIGTSALLTFTILPTELIPLRVESITFTGDSSDAFFFETFLLDGIVIDGVPPTKLLFISPPPPSPNFGTVLDVIVGFLPQSPGLHSAEIRIQSDAEFPENNLLYPLTGSGIGAASIPAPTPLALMAIGLAAIGFARRRVAAI